MFESVKGFFFVVTPNYFHVSAIFIQLFDSFLADFFLQLES